MRMTGLNGSLPPIGSVGITTYDFVIKSKRELLTVLGDGIAAYRGRPEGYWV